MFVERWNTASNLMYVVLGIVGMVQMSRVKPSPVRKYVHTAHLFILFLWEVIVGLASTVYHAIHDTWALGIDLGAILILAYLVAGFLIQHESYYHPTLWLIWVVLSAAFCLVSAGLRWYAAGMWSYYVIVGLMASLAVYRVRFSVTVPQRSNIPPSILMPVRNAEHRALKSWGHLAVGSMGGAVVVYLVPKFMCMSYVDTSIGPIMQLHAVWHLLSALALFAFIHAIHYFPR